MILIWIFNCWKINLNVSINHLWVGKIFFWRNFRLEGTSKTLPIKPEGKYKSALFEIRFNCFNDLLDMHVIQFTKWLNDQNQKLFFFQDGFSRLASLNLTTTRIESWSDIDNLRTFPALTELRFKNSPLLEDYTAHEKRMLLVRFLN